MAKKSPMEKYTLKQFLAEFPDDAACLEWLKNYRFPNGIFCKSLRTRNETSSR